LIPGGRNGSRAALHTTIGRDGFTPKSSRRGNRFVLPDEHDEFLASGDAVTEQVPLQQGMTAAGIPSPGSCGSSPALHVEFTDKGRVRSPASESSSSMKPMSPL
jgi:hypothetical protein